MRLIAFLVAVVGGFLLNLALPPEVMHTNQIVAVFGWGLVLAFAPAPALAPGVARAAMPVLGALGLVALGCALSLGRGDLPLSPALATLGLLLMAGLLVVHGAASGARDMAAAFRPFAIALVIAGLGSALIAIVQIFAPELTGNGLVAALVFPGRAVGNLGQPNLLADSLVWALAALVPLAHASQLRGQRIALGGAAALLLLGVILSGSRTGLLGIGLLFAWGLVDRKLPPAIRRALLAAPVALALLWGGLELWTQSQHLSADLGARAGSDITTSRGRIWAEALSLVAQQPLLGVGWGQFSFARTLTADPARYPMFIDNAHDLPLQLAVELGVPAAIVIVALLLVGLWLAFRRARAADGLAGSSRRAVLVIVAMVGIHSLLEYPLWYAFFLLPAAWAWGLALGASARAAEPAAFAPPKRAWRVVGALFMAASASAWVAYRNVASLYMVDGDPTSLIDRIRVGQSGLLFSTHADYMLAIMAKSPAQVLPEIRRAAHTAFNGRLIFTWARALEASGEDDKARYLAARLREFKVPAAQAFFAPCDDAAVTVKPFECLAPVKAWSWRDFR
jgi:O-antigen ligase